jgi:thymidylate synthase ThyX
MPNTEEPKKAKLIQPADQSTRRIYWLNHIRTKREDGEAVELRPTPEQLAVAIAKCSRSSTPFDQNVDDVSLEKAAEFHEKWVVGYGHASVAEHAVASVAFQNIPQTVIKILEDTRLASFTEVSSRYQVFNRRRVGVPKTLAQSEFADRVSELFDGLYGLYDELYALLYPVFQERQPQGDMPDPAYKATLKAMTCDRVRYLLPAAALASLGMTANARIWEHAIVKLLSSGDPLARQIGEEIKSVLRGFVNLDRDQALKHFPLPTLLKYADPSAYLSDLPAKMATLVQDLAKDRDRKSDAGATSDNPVVCTFDDHMAEHRIAGALLSRYARMPMTSALDILAQDPAKRAELIRAAVEERGPHETPPREFEHAWFQHEIIMDYGAWRDIQRHRICTQTNQPLGTDLGYDIPLEISEVGKAKEFSQVMDAARDLHRDILASGLAAEAQYVVPMAYRRRLLVGWNLRELFHFIELRSGKKGHPSYRRIAQEIWRTLDEAHPLLASLIRVDLSTEGVSTLGEKPKGF